MLNNGNNLKFNKKCNSEWNNLNYLFIKSYFLFIIYLFILIRDARITVDYSNKFLNETSMSE